LRRFLEVGENGGEGGGSPTGSIAISTINNYCTWKKRLDFEPLWQDLSRSVCGVPSFSGSGCAPTTFGGYTLPPAGRKKIGFQRFNRYRKLNFRWRDKRKITLYEMILLFCVTLAGAVPDLAFSSTKVTAAATRVHLVKLYLPNEILQ